MLSPGYVPRARITGFQAIYLWIAVKRITAIMNILREKHMT